MVKTGRITKKEAKSMADFADRFGVLMNHLGATRTSVEYPEYAITTSLGKLHVSLPTMDLAGYRTVFCRFDDPDKARQRLDCNPYSGKWNHNYFAQPNDFALDDFERQLSAIL